MAGLTLDAGALIAAERNDRGFWSFWSEAIGRDIVPVIPAAALAQAWRDPRQSRLARLVNACSIEALDEPLAKMCCGSSPERDRQASRSLGGRRARLR